MRTENPRRSLLNDVIFFTKWLLFRNENTIWIKYKDVFTTIDKKKVKIQLDYRNTAS